MAPCGGASFEPAGRNALPKRPYATRLVANGDVVVCAAGRSMLVVNRDTLAVEAKFKGHKGAVDDVCLFAQPTTMASCSSEEKAAKVWDLRQKHTVRTLEAGGECAALGVGGGDSLLALGADERIELWDLRTNAKLFVYEEVHTDLITQLQFHPFRPSVLVSGAEDSLVCQLATGEERREDDGLRWTVNIEDTVRCVRFLGDGDHHAVATASATDVVRLWSDRCESLGPPCDLVRDYKLLKEDFSCGYVVDLFNHFPKLGCASALGGSVGGRLVLFHVNLDGLVADAAFVAPAGAGHNAVVRGAVPLDGAGGAEALLACDEDGVLVAWRRTAASEA